MLFIFVRQRCSRAPGVRTPAPAPGRTDHQPIQLPGQIDIPTLGRDGCNAIHQDTHRQDDHEAAVTASRHHADTEVRLRY